MQRLRLRRLDSCAACVALAVVLATPSSVLHAQAPAREKSTPLVVHLVAEDDGRALVGARASTEVRSGELDSTFSDANGRIELREAVSRAEAASSMRSHASPSIPLNVGEVTIELAGHATTVIDALGSAPWAR